MFFRDFVADDLGAVMADQRMIGAAFDVGRRNAESSNRSQDRRAGYQ